MSYFLLSNPEPKVQETADFIDNDNAMYIPLRERNPYYLLELIFGIPPKDLSSMWSFNWEKTHYLGSDGLHSSYGFRKH